MQTKKQIDLSIGIYATGDLYLFEEAGELNNQLFDKSISIFNVLQNQYSIFCKFFHVKEMILIYKSAK